jgi:hypothetical protein
MSSFKGYSSLEPTLICKAADSAATRCKRLRLERMTPLLKDCSSWGRWAPGADVNAKDGYHGSALQAASAKGHDAVIQRLLELGADINA